MSTNQAESIDRPANPWSAEFRAWIQDRTICTVAERCDRPVAVVVLTRGGEAFCAVHAAAEISRRGIA